MPNLLVTLTIATVVANGKLRSYRSKGRGIYFYFPSLTTLYVVDGIPSYLFAAAPMEGVNHS